MPHFDLKRRSMSSLLRIASENESAHDAVVFSGDPPMPDDTITSLSEFVERVRRFRQLWNTPADKELWFRGERKKHEWKLRPKIYRPPEKRRIKPTSELLKIENELYEEFKRCGV
jgi:hypothetical protein